jgi:hypothetical protein
MTLGTTKALINLGRAYSSGLEASITYHVVFYIIHCFSIDICNITGTASLEVLPAHPYGVVKNTLNT